MTWWMYAALAAAVLVVLVAAALVVRQRPVLVAALIGMEERIEAVKRLQARAEDLRPTIAEIEAKLPRPAE